MLFYARLIAVSQYCENPLKFIDSIDLSPYKSIQRKDLKTERIVDKGMGGYTTGLALMSSTDTIREFNVN